MFVCQQGDIALLSHASRGPLPLGMLGFWQDLGLASPKNRQVNNFSLVVARVLVHGLGVIQQVGDLRRRSRHGR